MTGLSRVSVITATAALGVVVVSGPCLVAGPQPMEARDLPGTHVEAGDLELYGTFHAMGVTVPAGDAGKDTRASVEYRAAGEGRFRQGFPLARVKDKFIGSLFWLQPGTTYNVRVTVKDRVFEGACATRREVKTPDPKRTLYVSPEGKGGGQKSSPMGLAQALSDLKSGDHVVLRGGVYYTGDLTVNKCGTEQEPVVIRNHPGEEAILDGSNPAGPALKWKDEGNGFHRTSIDASLNDIYLLVMGKDRRLLRYGGKLADPSPKHTAAARQSFFADTRKQDSFYIDSEKDILYVNLHGADPRKAEWTTSRHKSAFIVQDGSFIYFHGLTFRYYHSVNAALKFTNASNCLVEKCEFHVNDTDVHVGKGTRDLVIQDNESYGGKVEWSFGAMKEAWQFEVSGFRFRGTSRGTVVRRNILRNHGDGLCLCPSSDTDMYDNLVHDCADDGVEVDGYGRNIRLWSNRFRNCYRGISLSPTRHGPVYCIRNTCHGLGSKTWNMFKIQYLGARGPMYLMHNSSFCAGGLKPVGSRGVSWDLVYTRNNIFSTSSGGGWGAAFDVQASRGPVDMDYDNFYRKTDDPVGAWNAAEMEDLDELHEFTDQEKHARSEDPRFANPGEGDFRLQPDSPVIDKGAVLPGINDCGPYRYQGAAPDMGAVESGGDAEARKTRPD